ncbi:MAG TPA: AAA family ATPase [Candidatus Limnocylindrales bacterium]
MRIDEIVVDGFGLLRDRRIEPAPGLTLVRGENEAGKTTVLAFIRAILFGFETKSPGALAGGLRGGRLAVTTGDGRPIRIERHGNTGGSGQLRVLDDEGDDLGAETLTRILQGVEKSVYRNIFAFGLAELTEFETLTGAAIADRIYGAGMGTGTTSVVEVENALEKVRSGIFVKGGRVPRINTLLAEIEELEARIDTINPPEIFRTAGTRRAALEAELSTVSAEAESISVARRRLERLRDGWSSWLALEAARGRFAERPPEPDDLPALAPDLLERLAGVESALARLTERGSELRAERDQAVAERDAAAVDDRLLDARPAVEAVLAVSVEARGDRAHLADYERDVAERSAAVAEAMRRLGPGWDEDRIQAVDDSLAAQGAILSQFRPALDAAERELGVARTGAASADQDLADARLELAAIAPPDSVVVFDRLQASPGRRPRAARAALLTWALVGLLAGLVAGEASLLAGLALALGAVVGIAAGVAVALFGIRAQSSGIHLAAPADPLAGPQAARLEERADRVRLLEDRARTAAGRLLAAETAHEQVMAGWQAWLVGHGLPQDVDRETAGRLLESVAQIRAGLAAIATLRARRDESRAHVAEFDARVNTLLASLGRTGDDPSAALEAVRRDLAASVAAAAARDRALRALERADGAGTANDRAHEAADAEYAAILAEARATDAPGVRAAVAAATERSEIVREIRAAEATLVALSGPGAAVRGLEADLATIGDRATIETDLAVEVERGQALDDRRASILEELGAERETIARIERSAESADLRQARADRVAELRELAESWSATTIALALLRRTRERYEREHRPEVLRAAEELLAAWTGGRYVRILAPLGRQVQELMRGDGTTVPLGGLSTGTAQQLYLALRFGLVDHFARQAESLPIVMDDILVNFDPVRAERAARSIEDLATRHQVLYFSCHPGTPLRATTTIELPTLIRG